MPETWLNEQIKKKQPHENILLQIAFTDVFLVVRNIKQIKFYVIGKAAAATTAIKTAQHKQRNWTRIDKIE